MVFAQTPVIPEINASKTNDDIKVDGVLRESEWIDANGVSDFWTNFTEDLCQRIIFIEDLECLLLIVSPQGYFNLSCLYSIGSKR